MPRLPRVLVADPPWPFKDKLPGKGRGAAKHYRTLSIDHICNYRIPRMSGNSYLFLWSVAAFAEEALQVMRAWDYVPTSEVIWVKTTDDGEHIRMGMGRTVRNSHERCIIGVRGKPIRKSAGVVSVFNAPRGRQHSRKPDEFYELVEELSAGPYRELFARRRRRGWHSTGQGVR